MGRFREIFSGRMNRALAAQVAKQVPREETLSEIKETWKEKLSSQGGSVDIKREAQEMVHRLKKSKYIGVFKAAGISEQDLKDTLVQAVEEMGRKTLEDSGRNSGPQKLLLSVEEIRSERVTPWEVA
jgi:hypothetical protein